MDAAPSSPAPALPGPELAFLTALWEVWQALTALGEAELRARHDLDLRALLVLAYVQGGTDQPARLARELGLPRYEVSRVLRALDSRGAVTRGPGRPDGRRVVVTITPRGRALWEAALGTVREVTGPPLAALGPRSGPLTRDLHALARTLHPSLPPTQETP